MIKIDTRHLEKFVSTQEINEIAPEIAKAQKVLNTATGRGNDFLGWVNLPTEIDDELINKIQQDADAIAAKAQIYVVIGIGGSYLGARAVIESLQNELAVLDPNRKRPYIVYAGHTLSEDYYSQLLSILDKFDYAMTVISKSGTTTEPAVAFRILKSHIEKKYGKEEARSRIIAITDGSKGALHNIAKQEGYTTYVIPDNVGGRYSVFTPVGLLPIAVSGGDIAKLIQGARDMQSIVTQEISITDNPAALYTAIRNILYRKGKSVEMMISYEPDYTMMNEWFKQLYGESEGKNGKGLFPASAVFSTDLHSLGQYVQEGERVMFETVVTFDKPKQELIIGLDPENGDGFNFVAGKSVDFVNQKAFLGTILAHTDGKVPNMVLEISEMDEYNFGYLVYFLEKACAVSGYILGINPFDQPGVESYKKNMFALLGKPGYEEHKKALEARLS
jgi:glucose-6-phosphate isomerase